MDTLKHPYVDLPLNAYWRSGVAETSPFKLEGIYKKKFDISKSARIATAGSCFAQHVGRALKQRGFNVLDFEPPPIGLPTNLHSDYGFSMYSARYGNIYTVAHLLQLAKEAFGEIQLEEGIWTKADRFFDAFRPTVEKGGYRSSKEISLHRYQHLLRVKKLFLEADIFVVTLGLTEAWVHKNTETVYPTAPGTIAGVYDPSVYQFRNFEYTDILSDFSKFQSLVASYRHGKKPLKYIITVSPVPLTATASEHHILIASTYSKAVLRAVAGKLRDSCQDVDYFPSYEIITNVANRGGFYERNLRTVTTLGVKTVMQHFFLEHDAAAIKENSEVGELHDAACEDALLDPSA